MDTPAKKAALGGVLCALALCLSLVENALPLTLLIPIPGVRLGLANLVTVFALYSLGFLPALGILAVRCFLASLLGGNLSALAFSLAGGLAALLTMWALKRLRIFSVWGVSIGGGAMHNAGQTAAAAAVLGGVAPVYYLPYLLLAGVAAGAVNGLIAMLLFNALGKKMTGGFQ